LLGSGYLIFLGARALLEAVRAHPKATARSSSGLSPRLTPSTALRQGLLSNLANPKMLAFFTSLLPQFASSPTGLLSLGLLFCSLTLAWLTAYTFVVARAGALLRAPQVRRVLEALTGTVLIALGTQLAMERR
jgi:threonine/homoserine/homoserine lactone efflux protein